jgi:hypothetical protein
VPFVVLHEFWHWLPARVLGLNPELRWNKVIHDDPGFGWRWVVTALSPLPVAVAVAAAHWAWALQSQHPLRFPLCITATLFILSCKRDIESVIHEAKKTRAT